MSRAEYDGIADWYDEAIREGPLAPFHDWIVPIVLDLAGEVRGYRTCDLACGQGVIARQLAARGASVVGVDISERLLETARRYERQEPLGVSYLLDDARALDCLEDASFDGVVCNMSLADISDLGSTLSSVSRVLRPGGWFVFSVVHPICQTPGSPRWVLEDDKIVGVEVRDYFAEGYWRRSSLEGGIRGRLGAYHRTLSTYVNELSASGLPIERLLEPKATGLYADVSPVHKDVPVALVVRCNRGCKCPAPDGRAA